MLYMRMVWICFYVWAVEQYYKKGDSLSDYRVIFVGFLLCFSK